MPLDDHHPVQEPDVEMLPTVNPRERMIRRQSAEAREIDVGVIAHHVDERVMEHVVLPTPEIRAAADEVETHRHRAIDPTPLGECLVARVVHDVEADRDHRQGQNERERQRLPPRRRHEYQQRVDGGKSRENDCGLEVHLGTAALRARSTLAKCPVAINSAPS